MTNGSLGPKRPAGHLILKKPFDDIELAQVARALTTNWENFLPFDLSQQFSAEGSARSIRRVARAVTLRREDWVRNPASGHPVCAGLLDPELHQRAQQVAADDLAKLSNNLETTATTAKDRY